MSSAGGRIGAAARRHDLGEPVGLALGAQAGPAGLEAVFREAGFTSIRTGLRVAVNIVLEVRR